MFLVFFCFPGALNGRTDVRIVGFVHFDLGSWLEPPGLTAFGSWIFR